MSKLKLPKVKFPRRRKEEKPAEEDDAVEVELKEVPETEPQPEPVEVAKPEPVKVPPPQPQIVPAAPVYIQRRGPDPEEIEMQRFRQRISAHRSSRPIYASRAEGWDYINWKPYEAIRYDYNPDQYLIMGQALAPYVHDVVVSGCEGKEEKRWKALTQSADSHYASREQLDSQRPSRMGSHENLLHP